jgi:hypothetical protein
VNLSIQEILTHRDSEFVFHHIPKIHRFPKFVALQVNGFESSRTCDFRGLVGSRFRAIARSRLRGFEGSGLQITAHSRLPDFVSSRLQIFASSLPLKSCITNFINLDVSRVTSFYEFPNTSPSGKRVDSDDPIPRTFRNFSKKRHPRNVGGDTRHPETSQRSNRGTFAELPPSPL